MRVPAAAAALALAAAPAAAASLDVIVDGIEPGAGTVYVALCQGGLSEGNCRLGQDAPPAGPSRRFAFRDVPPGAWAALAYQDANGNGRLDRTGLGLPTEPYGLSGGAGRRARPDFSSARFALPEAGASIRVRLARALPAR